MKLLCKIFGHKNKWVSTSADFRFRIKICDRCEFVSQWIYETNNVQIISSIIMNEGDTIMIQPLSSMDNSVTNIAGKGGTCPELGKHEGECIITNVKN